MIQFSMLSFLFFPEKFDVKKGSSKFSEIFFLFLSFLRKPAFSVENHNKNNHFLSTFPLGVIKHDFQAEERTSVSLQTRFTERFCKEAVGRDTVSDVSILTMTHLLRLLRYL